VHFLGTQQGASEDGSDDHRSPRGRFSVLPGESIKDSEAIRRRG
jgi:hypothetical protein